MEKLSLFSICRVLLQLLHRQEDHTIFTLVDLSAGIAACTFAVAQVSTSVVRTKYGSTHLEPQYLGSQGRKIINILKMAWPVKQDMILQKDKVKSSQGIKKKKQKPKPCNQ